MRSLLASLLALFFFGENRSQPTAPPPLFKTKPGREAALLTTGAGLLLGGKIMEKRLDGLTVAQVGDLLAGRGTHRSFAEKNHSQAARRWSNRLLWASPAPAVFVCLKEARTSRDFLKNSLVAAETALLTLGATALTKSAARRPRPLVFNENVPIEQKTGANARLSFFSGHTSTTAAACFFSAKTWAMAHPDSPKKKWVWAAAATYPLAVGFLRMKAGKHYLRDVATGYAIGAGIGIGVPAAHRFLVE